MPEARDPSILAVNAGSSTLKFGVFPVSGGHDSSLHGAIEYSGVLRTVHSQGATETTTVSVTPETAAALLFDYLTTNPVFNSVKAVGHRIVHGGLKLRQPVAVDDAVRASLDEVVPLAPNHLPAELRAIDEFTRKAPSLPQFACFDTAFHRDMPAAARLFGLPRPLADSGVIRYGFHGLSYEYVVETLRERGELAPRTVIAHLGNGASIAAVRDGVSIDTSMGMTPSGGLVMSTRSGDLDPGVILYLLRARRFSLSELDEAINSAGGLLGISELSADLRDLLEASGSNSKAEAAVESFCYSVRKFIGAYAAALGGIDALVFTGGVGEHSAKIRSRICEKLDFIGIRLDAEMNLDNAPVISEAVCRVAVRIVETNEEAMVATHVREFLNQRAVRGIGRHV